MPSVASTRDGVRLRRGRKRGGAPRWRHGRECSWERRTPRQTELAFLLASSSSAGRRGWPPSPCLVTPRGRVPPAPPRTTTIQICDSPAAEGKWGLHGAIFRLFPFTFPFTLPRSVLRCLYLAYLFTWSVPLFACVRVGPFVREKQAHSGRCTRDL